MIRTQYEALWTSINIQLTRVGLASSCNRLVFVWPGLVAARRPQKNAGQVREDHAAPGHTPAAASLHHHYTRQTALPVIYIEHVCFSYFL